MKVDGLGDSAVRWSRPANVDPRPLLAALRRHPGVVDVVITEEHVAVYFDPAAPPRRPWEVAPDASAASSPKTLTIRARYDGEDLAEVAARSGLSTHEVVRLHSSATYTVSMLGFLPGFAYLRGLPPALVVPRRAKPRERVPAGSLAIAAEYTGIYPFASPGGWNLLGRSLDFTPFSPDRGAAWSVGDLVRFEAAP